jgi:hypothetical protein
MRGLRDVLGSEKFQRRPPKVVVWGFVERSIHGSRFPKYQPPGPPQPKTLTHELTEIWQGIRLPPHDRRSYRAFWQAYRDKWSMLRAYALAVRAEATYRLWGRLLTDKVLVGERPDGSFALFLTSGVRSLSRTAKQRQLDKVAEGIESVHAECARRGIHLIVLLIPDKAHVYPRWLKPEDRPEIPEPDALADLESRLTRRGVHVVIVLPIYLARNGDDQPLLYYPDDTHWTEHGIRLAMEAVAASLGGSPIRIAGEG